MKEKKKVDLSSLFSKNDIQNAHLGEYQGKPIMTLGPEDSRFPFSFGAGKAKLLLALVEELEEKEISFRDVLARFIDESGKK